MLDSSPKRALANPKTPGTPKMQIREVNLWYGPKQALKDVTFDIYQREVLAFIGPSGCGKSTMLKCLNRMHDGVRGVKLNGKILLDGKDVMAPDIDPPLYRRHFGWVAQKPDPFPMSIYENIAYGPRIHGIAETEVELDNWVEECLTRADLWEEVKDILHKQEGTSLSGGQQQRLCIARALSIRPDFLLMDEPTGSIDPIATRRIEDLIHLLRNDLSIVIITHSMAEAGRVSDRVAFFHMGELREIGPTDQIFTNPKDPKCRDFLTGRYG